MASKIFLIFVLTFTFQTIPVMACFKKVPPSSLPSDAFSPVDLANLANFESKLYNILALIGGKYQEYTSMPSYLTDYQKSTIEGTSKFPEGTGEWIYSTAVASHPFMAFRMIRRLIVDLPDVIILLEQHQEIEALTLINISKAKLKWPTIKDKEDVMERIIRIQNVYDLDVAEFAEGEGDVSGVRLSAAHCVEIGRYALEIGKHASAAEWINIALRKVFTRQDPSLALDQVMLELVHVVTEHDRILKHFNLRHSGNLDNLWDHDLFQVPVGKLDEFKESRLRHLSQPADDPLFKALELCAGANYQPEQVKSKLNCWYDTRKHSYSHISPMKVELLSQDPYLVQVHDFLSTQGVLNIIDETIITLDQYVNVDTSAISENVHGSRKRRSSPMILMDDGRITAEFKDLTSKLECFTGHSEGKCTAERLQVIGYTFGNSDLHLESPDGSVDLDTSTIGDIATVMVFLNEVEVGGYTVFPKIGIFVKPMLGSALFWLNSMGGKKIRDTRLMYTECPVILGKKWIAKKKIHSNGRF